MTKPRTAGDYGFNGFFELRDPHALFQKLRFDYDRMLTDPMSIYPVYDFFVTANHLVDWIWPSAGSQQHRVERSAETIPRICEHLANGAKHFVVNRPHAAVARLESVVAPRVDLDGILGDPSELALAWLDNDDGFYVSLELKEARELGTDNLTALDLAQQVLIYWGRRMGYGDIASTLPCPHAPGVGDSRQLRADGRGASQRPGIVTACALGTRGPRNDGGE